MVDLNRIFAETLVSDLRKGRKTPEPPGCKGYVPAWWVRNSGPCAWAGVCAASFQSDEWCFRRWPVCTCPRCTSGEGCELWEGIAGMLPLRACDTCRFQKSYSIFGCKICKKT
jgi:hypothetical protein